MKRVIIGLILGFLLISFQNVSATVLFSDDFEYVVTRNQTGGASTAFQNGGRWTWAKTRQDDYGARSNGYFYTVTSIPGSTGSFPGRNSSRVLCMEFLPQTLGGQTDAYLAYAGEAGNTIPSNVWIQFWIYLQRYGNQMSRFYRGKFLYPSLTGNYPADANTGFDWLMHFSDESSYCLRGENGAVSLGQTNFVVGTTMPGTATGARCNPYTDFWRSNHLGRNQGALAGVIPSNTWRLVKIHLNTSGSEPGNHRYYRMWTSSDGVNWTLAADWAGGTANLTWNGVNTQGGHKALKLGTTVDNYDSWWYMDDFVIATSENSLPTYNRIGNNPMPPSRLRIMGQAN